MSIKPIKRYHKTDGWRGYRIPARAVLGASDTGTWDDSPCPSALAEKELNWFRRSFLRPNKIRSRVVFGETSNVFCAKRWLVVSNDDWERAAWMALRFLHNQQNHLRLAHDAGQRELLDEKAS